MKYVHITPKIITATILFALLQYSTLRNITFETGLFSILYYLIGTYGLGYNINWKEVTSATLICGVLLNAKLKPTVALVMFIALMAITRPLCYVT